MKFELANLSDIIWILDTIFFSSKTVLSFHLKNPLIYWAAKVEWERIAVR